MRARQLGISSGLGTPGEFNAITDVPGVRVGHSTICEGRDGKPVRTGVTVAGGACTSGSGTSVTDASDADNGSFVSGNVTVNFPSPGVAAGATTAALFQVTIN